MRIVHNKSLQKGPKKFTWNCLVVYDFQRVNIVLPCSYIYRQGYRLQSDNSFSDPGLLFRRGLYVINTGAITYFHRHLALSPNSQVLFEV